MADSADSPQQAGAPTKKVPSKTGYHYWHAHGHEKKDTGDVAPMPTHVALASEASNTPTEVASEIQKYSWCNNKTSVSVYVDCDGATETNTRVEFAASELAVRVELNEVHVKVLKLPLAKECDPEKSSFRFKPNQIIVKLAKAKDDETWFDLISKS
jgi:hypothetical protein